MRSRPPMTCRTAEDCLAVDREVWQQYARTFRDEARSEMEAAVARGDGDTATHWRLFAEVVELDPRDWSPYGLLDREQGDTFGADCSVGCTFYVPLIGDLAADWGVCTNPLSHRAGRLTFEHQACLACVLPNY